MSLRASFGQFVVALVLAGCGAAPRASVNAKAPTARPEAPLTPAQHVERGERTLRTSEYAAAEAHFRGALSGSTAARANLGLARVLLVTGRFEEAVSAARAAQSAGEFVEHARVTAAEALFRAGRLDDAKAELAPLAAEPNARRAKLLLGELELQSGQRKRAEPLFMSLIEDYNEERITEKDADGLLRAARAAWLLRSPRDANTLFTAAERQSPGNAELLLLRAQLFLEKYDPANAEQVLKEVLETAPKHPEALTLLAQVRLDQALDFDEAERLALAALAINPRLAQAHFVLAGIALRDMELEKADREIDAGLKTMPRDLDLLSLRAVVRFLADDRAGFERTKRAVLELNPEYSRLYAILGEYADWEHRYDEIVVLMREALVIDKEDAGALAQLGLNLIRAGKEREGVSELSRAFALDAYNVRVYNTLGLFDTLIPKSYVSVSSPRFSIRYHKDDRAILERYVPALLERAFDAMRVSYDFTPETPIGIELYAERESFAVRTSGLPQTAIQGVCFGRTLAAMSPQRESFNLGMTLWHELSHVFHIQLSKARVPRWFTEGLAEYETLVTRPEWSRQHDPELYEMMRVGKLPSVGRMSRAFTRAEALSDIATAYYASTKIVEMLARDHGRPKIARMLRLWGEGRRTEEVFGQALGATPDGIDQRFREYLKQTLSRYDQQFVPISRTRSRELLETAAKSTPKDQALWLEVALSRLNAGDLKGSAKAIAQVLAQDPKNPQARFMSARIASERDDKQAANSELRQLLKDGVDGYAIHVALGDLARARGDSASARAAFEQAARLDPTQSEPLIALADIAATEKVWDDELEKLEKLAPLSAHSPAVYRRLLTALIAKKRYADAVRVGESAIYSDINGLDTHVLFAQALEANGDTKRAVFELESALLCPGEAKQLADVHARLAELFEKTKRPAEVKRHKLEAVRLLQEAPKTQ
ncbi:MAG: tetratricopeptide repeat protein [Myxococcota bacterium]